MQRRQALGRELGAAVDQARLLGAVLHRPARDVVVVGLVGLAEVGGVGVRHGPLAAHPVQGGAGVEAAGKGDADALADGKVLQDRGHGSFFASLEDAFRCNGGYFHLRRHPRTREMVTPGPAVSLGSIGRSLRRSMSTLPPTVNKPSAGASAMEHDALPAGTRFGEFEILRVLGVGGFGIVYLARDHSLERDVALKEYMPASLAARGAGPQITVRSSSFAETYAIGLRSFINEARLLARFDHPSLVKVYRFWEDNATAYMVMPYLQGITLRDMRRRMAHPPDEAWVRSVILPILSALELLHREGVYHRDIAPDNILLPPDGAPVLLDFGAARRVISDRTQSLTAILKPSYAPIEQYAEMTQLRQGPWTDLYALGAVVHYLLFGAPPAPATARAVQDDADAIETRVLPGVSPSFLEAMSWMLTVRPNGRPQSGEQLRAVLDGSAEIPPRGRPGITIPSQLNVAPGSAGAGSADKTRVNTAYMPTFMPTAHVPPGGGPAKAAPVDPASAPTTFNPTTFSPKTQMPTARAAPTHVEAAAAAPVVAPSAPTPLAPAAATRPAPSEGPASRPAALASGFAPSSSFGTPAGPASRPAPEAVPAAFVADAAAGPSEEDVAGSRHRRRRRCGGRVRGLAFLGAQRRRDRRRRRGIGGRRFGGCRDGIRIVARRRGADVADHDHDRDLAAAVSPGRIERDRNRAQLVVGAPDGGEQRTCASTRQAGAPGRGSGHRRDGDRDPGPAQS